MVRSKKPRRKDAEAEVAKEQQPRYLVPEEKHFRARVNQNSRVSILPNIDDWLDPYDWEKLKGSQFAGVINVANWGQIFVTASALRFTTPACDGKEMGELVHDAGTTPSFLDEGVRISDWVALWSTPGSGHGRR